VLGSSGFWFARVSKVLSLRSFRDVDEWSALDGKCKRKDFGAFDTNVAMALVEWSESTETWAEAIRGEFMEPNMGR
jgi:hypothetical protein